MKRGKFQTVNLADEMMRVVDWRQIEERKRVGVISLIL